MTRAERLEEIWQRLEDMVREGDDLMWMGHTTMAIQKFEAVWQTFRREFPTRREREVLGYGYLDGMSTVMNRLFCALSDEQEEEQWNLCWELCHFFQPGEIWIEMYASHLGRLMHERGLFAECDQWFEDHMEEEPDEAGYAANYAQCLFERGELQRAEAALDAGLEEGLEEGGESSGVLVDYGLIAWELYAKMNRVQKAQRCIRRLMEEDLLEIDAHNEALYKKVMSQGEKV